MDRATLSPSENAGSAKCQTQGVIDAGIASYTRYSSDNQDGSSIEQQNDVISAGALKQGHRVASELRFSDEAVSGTKLQREGLDRLMVLARAGIIKVLYVYSLSRLARESLISLGILKELVEVLGIRVISVSENIDTQVANWDLLATFFSYQHGQYIKVLSADVLRGLQYNLDNDFSVGDWCFGYHSEVIPGQENTSRFKRGKPRKRVVIHPVQTEMVRQVFYWFVREKRSINWIARELTKLCVAKLHGSRTPIWHHDTVKLMLENRKYIGDWQWGKTKIKRIPMTGQIIKVPRTPEELEDKKKDRARLRILDDALFYEAQVLLKQAGEKFNTVRRKDGTFKGPTNDHSQPRHLLQGAIRCI